MTALSVLCVSTAHTKSLCQLYDAISCSISNFYTKRSTFISAREERRRATSQFLPHRSAGFLFCVIAIWRPRPYRQLEAKFQRYKKANLTLHPGRTKEADMDKTEHRFSESAIDELNERLGRRVPTKDFALLMIGLVILLVLLYVQIVW
jgi:hypothetical protein